MSEYIGSRISLISKSDIRYVGTLHEINSEKSTVALENVSSHGTEGRRGNPNEEIPGSDQVYEYIVFRGSDVKELSIVEPPKENKPPAPLNDPAILGSARPPPQGPPQHPQHPPHNQFPPQPQFQQQHNFPPPPGYYPPPRFHGPGQHGFPGQPGAVPGYNPGFQEPPPHFYGGPPPGPGFGPGMRPGEGFGHGQPPADRPSQGPTPTNPKPEATQAARVAAQKPAEMSGTPAPAASNDVPLQRDQSNAVKTPANQAATTAAERRPAQKPANQRVAVPLAAQKPRADKPVASYADATQAATAAVAAAMAQIAPAKETPQSDNLTNKFNQLRVGSNDTRGRGRGRGVGLGAGARGGRREARPVEVPKEDFDFESANAKFNKQAIADDVPAEVGTNGDGESGRAEENGDDVIIPPKPSAEKGYDRKASFFDNLSSDLKDRVEGQTVDGRAMRYQERNKNMETFGQGSVDNYRGGFRGRGRGRGFQRGRGGNTRFDGSTRGGAPRGRARGAGDSEVAA